MGVGDNLMVPLARLVGRIRVDHSISEVGQVMERLVAHLHGDRVGGGNREASIHSDVDLGMEAMADPSSADLPDLPDPGHTAHRMP